MKYKGIFKERSFWGIFVFFILYNFVMNDIVFYWAEILGLLIGSFITAIIIYYISWLIIEASKKAIDKFKKR